MGSGEGGVCVHIVDDDASVRHAYHRLLGSEGLQVQSWASASEFLACTDTLEPGCVLLDISACRGQAQGLQRLLGRRHDLPLIAISGDEGEAVGFAARAAGARLLFRKPVDGRALLDAVQWLAHDCVPESRGQR